MSSDLEESPNAARPLLPRLEELNEEEEMVVHSINPRVAIVQTASSSSNLRMQNAPEDTFSFCYLVFYLLGMTSILPWNFILMSEDYWLHKFRNISANNSDVLTPRQAEMQADLSMSSAIPSMIFLILHAIYGHRIALNVRIVGAYVMMTILMTLTTLFVHIDTDTWQDGFFYITIAITVLINSASAISSGSLFGMAGQFPSEYMTAVVSGQALGGIFAALAEILIITFGFAPETSAFFYFIVGSGALFVSIILYVCMTRSFFFKYFTMQQLARSTSSCELLAEPIHEVRQPQFKRVLSKMWIYGFSEWLVFVTTLAIYPAVTVLVVSENKGSGHLWNDLYFVPVVNYLLFNCGDYFGRILAGLFEKPKDRPFLVAFFSIARILFIPVLALCHTSPRHRLPILIHSDTMFIALMTGLALTNGYFANIAMICTPRVVKDHEKEMASSIMAAFLGIGLACGSLVSFLLVELI